MKRSVLELINITEGRFSFQRREGLVCLVEPLVACLLSEDL